MAHGDNWTLEETTMAFALYFKLEPREYVAKTPDVIKLAEALGRTPKSVKAKLENLKSNDPWRLAAGQKGLDHGAKIEKVIWDRYFEEGGLFLEEAHKLLQQTIGSGDVEADEGMPTLYGGEKIVSVARWLNQKYFRNKVMENYDGACCVTGINVPALLVASHIKPWAVSDEKTEQLAVSNGLLLDSLHGKAFDKGLITLDKDLKVVLSSELKRAKTECDWLRQSEGRAIRAAKLQGPDPLFIEYHNDVIFKG